MRLFYIACLLVCFSTQIQAQHAIPKETLDSLFKIASSTTNFPEGTAILMLINKTAEATHDTSLMCKVQLCLGRLAMLSENNDALKQAIAKSEAYATTVRDTYSLASVYRQKAVAAAKATQFDLAAELFKRSSDYFLISKDTISAANAFAKVGNILEMTGKYQEAHKYYLDYYNFTRKNPESLSHMTSNIYLTGNYAYLQQTEKAAYHNGLVLALAKKLNRNYEYSEALRSDALIAAQKGAYKDAYHKMKYFASYYQDTLMNEQSRQQAEEFKAKYESEKKENQIALQEAQLERERFRFWVVIAGLVTALVAGGLLFRLARSLRKRNEEKEFLIKEVHHRVKNNLQILSSLLHLQSRQITDDTALDAVREGQSRVDAMGLIHQKLYMGDNVAKVEMKDYLQQFGQNILDSFGISDDHIDIQYELEPTYFDVDTAIPLGLIINELVTNSLKYAFPGDRKGIITIALHEADQKHLSLTVSDNGVGQSAATQDSKSTSFGTNLVQMLSKKLKGKVEIIQQENGYATRIIFEKYS